MIIGRYRGQPQAYAPDIGEVVLARLSPSEPPTRAVVYRVRRNRQGALRCDFYWLESNSETQFPVVEGATAHVYIREQSGGSLLIQQIDKGPPSPPTS